MALNNNQVAAVINEAKKMATGAEDINTLDLSGIVDQGNDPTIIGEKEQFTKALIALLAKNWFTDSSYRSQYKDVFLEDSERFKAIVQTISVEVPEVKESHAWKDFSPVTSSGSTTYATAGVYNLYLPVINTQYFGKSISWELPIAITNEQWDMAFSSESELRSFTEYILMCVDNALVIHLENMNNANRNAFMASKIAYAASPDAVGVHVVNLVKEYQLTQATPADMTVEEFLNSDTAMQYATEELLNYKGFMQKMTTLFNTAGRDRFVPNDRLVVQILDKFENRLNRVARSNVFNNELVALPLHEKVTYWQGMGEGGTFDEVSAIDVKVTASGDDVTKSGIVAFMADKWACMHTIKNHRVASTYFDPEAVTQYYYQYRDQYMNDLTMNAIVFVLEDYTA